jgi:hypothetical protein
MRALLAAVVVALALPAALATAQVGNGVIAYTRDPDGPGGADPTVYVARPDGSGERAVATGYAPMVAAGHLAYSVRSGGAAQLVVDGKTVTSLPDREGEFGPGRYGVYGGTWAATGEWLALRLVEGSTTTLGFVRRDGGGFKRLEFGHLVGSRLPWRDTDTIAVGTDAGLRLVTVNGDVTTPPGGRAGDTPVGWRGTDGLVVNDAQGDTVLVDVGTGRRTTLATGCTGQDVYVTVLCSTATTLVRLDSAGERTPIGVIPDGVQVTNVFGSVDPPLVEVVTASGESQIGTLSVGDVVTVGLRQFTLQRATDFAKVASGSDLAVATDTAYDTVVAAASAAPSPAGSAGPSAGRAPGPAAGHERSTFTTALPTARDVSTKPSALVVSALLTLLLMLLVTFPAELFNSTLEEHYDEVRGWFHLGPVREPAERTRGQRAAMFAGYVAAAALLYGLLDPHFGFDAASLRLYAGIALGLVVVTIAFNAAPLLYVRRRYRESGALRVLPGTLLIGVFCVVVSRLASFEPGYLYGVVAGFAFSRAFTEDEEGRATLVTVAGVLAVTVVAWLLWQPVNDAAADGHPGLLLGLADTTLATVAIGGLEGLVIGLLPLRSLKGYALSRWSRPAWAAAFGGSLFLFVHLLLRPGSESRTGTPFVTWLVLFVAFGAASVAFWAYFRARTSSG